MTITRDNAAECLARLDGWRMKAAAAGRDSDVSLLDAVSSLIASSFPRERVSTLDPERGAFVPTGTPCVSDRPECCPWTFEAACARCQVNRPRPFTTAQIPGKAFVCLTYWRPA